MNVERVQACEAWVRHFRRNRERDWRIPWASGARLSDAERRALGASIAEFQRGESSEARHYLEKSEAFSGRTGDAAFHAASILFVREENEHAALLGRFMAEAGIPRRERSAADAVFRRLRGAGDLGWASRVLVVAELIAQEYYPCLRAATRHPALERLCDKIIADERDHIRFQVERIVRVEAALGSSARALRDLMQRALMEGVALVVYAGHRGVIGRQTSFGAFRARVVARNRALLAALWRCEQGAASRATEDGAMSDFGVRQAPLAARDSRVP